MFIRYAIVAEDDIANAMRALEQRNGALLGNDRGSIEVCTKIGRVFP